VNGSMPKPYAGFGAKIRPHLAPTKSWRDQHVATDPVGCPGFMRFILPLISNFVQEVMNTAPRRACASD
jgi:hypothetical protein